MYGSTTKVGVIKRPDCILVYGSTTKGDVDTSGVHIQHVHTYICRYMCFKLVPNLIYSNHFTLTSVPKREGDRSGGRGLSPDKVDSMARE